MPSIKFAEESILSPNSGKFAVTSVSSQPLSCSVLEKNVNEMFWRSFMNVKNNGVKASAPATFFNDSQLRAPKCGVTRVSHCARAVHHVSGQRELQRRPNVGQ